MTVNSQCTQKTSIAKDAKCAKFCDGVCNTGEIGCLRGLPAWQRRVVPPLQSNSGPMQPSNGQPETEETLATGVDSVLMRWVMVGIVIVWCLAPIVALRGCSA